MAQHPTANGYFEKHDSGDLGWDTDMNVNLDNADALIKANALAAAAAAAAAAAETVRAESAEGTLSTAITNEANTARANEAKAQQLFNERGLQTSAITLAGWDSAEYNLTAGSITQPLPATPTIGVQVRAAVSTTQGNNALTLTWTANGGGSVTLKLPGDNETVEWNGTTWTHAGDHKGLDNFDVRYASAVAVLQAQQYKTTADQANLLNNVTPPSFAPLVNFAGQSTVVVQPSDRYQQILGFGAALTDAAAYCALNYLNASQRSAILNELFSPSQCGWSMVRIGFGASDFQQSASYNYESSVPSGSTDPSLLNFNLGIEQQRVIPLLQQILAINPRTRIHGSIWFPPTWLGGAWLTNNFTINTTSINGVNCMQIYANYIVQALQAYAALGVPIWGLSPMNEPLDKGGNISNIETFVGTYLGPTMEAAGLTTRLFCGEQSWNQSGNMVSMLGSSPAGQYFTDVAWHGYLGTVNQQNDLHRQFPNVGHHFTEMRTLLSANWASAAATMAGDCAVGAIRNWAQSVTLWNLFLDQAGAPNNGVSTGRRGVVTIQNDSSGTLTRFVEYYMLTHLSKYVLPGAVRIASTSFAVGAPNSGLQTVAFQNLDGSIVLFCFNNSASATTFTIADGRTNTGFPVTMAGYEMDTFVWGTVKQGYASAVTAPTVPATPTLTATAHSAQITLSWSAPTSSMPLSGYQLLRSSTSGAETLLIPLTPGATSYTDVCGAGTFYYQLVAQSAAGNSTASTEVSATATAATVPTTPTLTVVAGINQVTLTLGINLVNTPVTAINVLRSTTSGSETALITLPSNQTSYVDSGLTAGTTYYYKITATNTTGTSTASAEASATATGAVQQPVFDAASSGNGNNVSSVSWTHTVGSSLVNSIVIVAVGNGGTGAGVDYPTGVTYGGVAMTAVPGGSAASSSATSRTTTLYYLLNPPAGASTVVVTLNVSNTNFACVAASFSHAAQSSTFGTAVTQNSASSASASATATSAATTDLEIAAVTWRNYQPATTGSLTARSYTSQGTSTYINLATMPGSGGSDTVTFTTSTADNEALVVVPLHGG